MLYANLRTLIQRSLHTSWLHDEDVGILTLKDDVQVNLVSVPSGEPRAFDEAWVKVFADQHAFRGDFELRYAGAFVERYTVISVDGGRHVIPLPTRDLKLSPYDHHLGEILNQNNLDRYEEALSQAGITIA